MKNEFANCQNMHLAVVALLGDPDHLPAWKDQKPVIFTTRAAELLPMVAAPIDLSLSAWRRLRYTELLAKAKLLHKSITASLADYGLDAADATLLAKETEDFEEIIADPTAAAANRSSLSRNRRSFIFHLRNVWLAYQAFGQRAAKFPPSLP